jgi:hypothetical protein
MSKVNSKVILEKITVQLRYWLWIRIKIMEIKWDIFVIETKLKIKNIRRKL